MIKMVSRKNLSYYRVHYCSATGEGVYQTFDSQAQAEFFIEQEKFEDHEFKLFKPDQLTEIGFEDDRYIQN
jgi:hypothetical protein